MTSQNETMTVKEISDLVGCSDQTVRRKIKELFPALLKYGKETILQKDEALLVVGELKATIKKQIQPRQNVALPQQNVADERLQRLENLVENLIKSIPLIVSETVSNTVKQIQSQSLLTNQNAPKQIETKKERMTVREYCNQNNITDYNFNSFLIQVGRKCTKISKELLRNISSKMEGEYPVSIYDVDIIKHCVEMVKIENERKNTLFGGLK